MGFPRLGFLGGLASLVLGSIGLSRPAAFDLSTGGDITMDPGISAVIARRSGSRSYGSKPGERAHRRWRKARASGRHDFRRTLKRKAA